MQNLKMKLSQKLSLSPQMMQMIHLLSLPAMELSEEVRRELEENPVLEEKSDTTEELSELEREESESREGLEDFTQITAAIPASHLKEMVEKAGGASSEKIQERQTPVEETLEDHLVWQIHFSHFKDEEKKILFLIAGEIGEDGYLKETIENLSKSHGLELKKVEHLLGKLQEFDPPGVGARNLKECLLIQARRIGEDTKDMVRLIENHLEDLKTKNYKTPAEALNLDIEEIKYMAEIIVSMEPFPGRLFHSAPIQYVTPDIYIQKKKNQEGVYEAFLNEDNMPQIQITSYYTSFLSRMGAGLSNQKKEARRYLSDKMKRALSFIRALNQRRDMMLKLGRIIAEEQAEFFEKGDRFLRPLLQKEVSIQTGVSGSTISRTVANKFVHTPRGMFELKYFFGTSYLDRSGRRLSVSRVQEMIQDIIKKSSASPISNEKISRILYENYGIKLTRRQVIRLRRD